MKTVTVPGIVAAASSAEGWPLFLQLTNSMVQLEKSLQKTTPEDFAAFIGNPGFISKEVDEHRDNQARQAEFEAFAALADFMNVVTTTRA